MNKYKWGSLAGLLLLITSVGCNQTTPQATESPQAVISPQAIASPQTTASPQPTDPSAATLKEIQGDGVALSVPANYEGGNPSTDLDEIAADLKAIDPNYEARIQAIEQNAETIALLAFDTQQSSSGFITNVNVSQQEVPAGITLEQYLQTATQQLSTQYNVLEQNIESQGEYRMGKIIAQPKTEQVPIKQLFYVVQQGETFWLVTYSTTQSEFDQRLPNFEQSIRTFTVQS
jgi:hypothetical protein